MPVFQSWLYGSDEQVSRESLDSTILGQFIVVAVVSVYVCSSNAKCFELNDIDVHMTNICYSECIALMKNVWMRAQVNAFTYLWV